MTVDVEIKFTDKVDPILVGGRSGITTYYDEDYCETFDDVVNDVEENLWHDYGFTLHHNEDFIIVNEDAIYDELGE